MFVVAIWRVTFENTSKYIYIYIYKCLRVVKTSWIVTALKIGPIICAEKQGWN